MNPGGPFETRVLAAEGYIELGMFLDANAELEEIQPEHRDASEVLALRVQIYGALEKWALMQTVARRLAVIEPENVQWTVSWAYATRRAESIEAARLILLSAVETLPNAAILHYNLACYECQLGDVEVAKTRLQHACKLEPIFRTMALEDQVRAGTFTRRSATMLWAGRANTPRVAAIIYVAVALIRIVPGRRIDNLVTARNPREDLNP